MLRTEQLQNPSIHDLPKTGEKTKKRGAPSKSELKVLEHSIKTDDTAALSAFEVDEDIVKEVVGERIDPKIYFLKTKQDIGNWLRPKEDSDNRTGWNKILVAVLAKWSIFDEDIINDVIGDTAVGCFNAFSKIAKELKHNPTSEVVGLSLNIIIGIMFNKKGDYFRKLYKRKNEDLLDCVDLVAAPDLTKSLILIEALRALPDIDCKALLLRYWVGLSVTEVADLEDRSYKGMEAFFSRAREKLRNELYGSDLSV